MRREINSNKTLYIVKRILKTFFTELDVQRRMKLMSRVKGNFTNKKIPFDKYLQK